MYIFTTLLLVCAGMHASSCLPVEKTASGHDLFEDLFEIQNEPTEIKTPEIIVQKTRILPDLDRRRVIISSRHPPTNEDGQPEEDVVYMFDLLKKYRK